MGGPVPHIVLHRSVKVHNVRAAQLNILSYGGGGRSLCVLWALPPLPPHTWDPAVRTLRMPPEGQRPAWLGAEDMLTMSGAAHVRQPTGNNKDCGVCVLLSTVGTLLRVLRLGNLLSTVDRRWVAAMVLNRDMGLIMRLP